MSTELMRSMLSRAAHLPDRRSVIVTEHVDGTCIQVEGRPTFRKTLDGMQPTVSFHWFVVCKRSSKAKVAAIIAASQPPGAATPKGGE